ncbi:hypothetical protein [Lelliottia sp. CFBP8978]|uniref:hypothetical protein n=1 Tax=Lelliottia sp. CFBP8978 TaxID=3096522 RepID=UPI002A6A9D10|nr:hypothetical protein [Lelliottia sp. CFBP8978]MDY1035710.1 hypothetical protein [Lelliottia sp. CFBP8978]
MTTTTKLTKRDDRFARLVAEAAEAPGFCYAKSRDREYKGFNDDFQAEKLLKNNDINQAVSTYKKHILSRDVLSRQEALVKLTRIRYVLNAKEEWFTEEVNWYDNPFFNETLEEERVTCLMYYPDRYRVFVVETGRGLI